MLFSLAQFRSHKCRKYVSETESLHLGHMRIISLLSTDSGSLLILRENGFVRGYPVPVGELDLPWAVAWQLLTHHKFEKMGSSERWHCWLTLALGSGGSAVQVSDLHEVFVPSVFVTWIVIYSVAVRPTIPLTVALMSTSPSSDFTTSWTGSDPRHAPY